MQFSRHRFNQTEQAILQTLLYSDIFDFPLTKAELWQFLLADTPIQKKAFEQALSDLVYIKPHRKRMDQPDVIFERTDPTGAREVTAFSGIILHKGLYCLSGRDSILEKRQDNFIEVKKKLRRAQKAAYLLSFIPTVKFIGLTGGLAIGNATKEDDIDFFIITQKNTLFITRFWILVLLEAFFLRRKRHDKNPANKICVNLLLDESNLVWDKKDQSLYIAHEIVQMRPLFQRDEMYQKFITSNYWVNNYLPNFNKRQQFSGKMKKNSYLVLRFLSFFLFLRPFEEIMRIVQKYYMKTHKTTEIVTDTILALHPYDYKFKTMEILASKSEKLGLLTNL